MKKLLSTLLGLMVTLCSMTTFNIHAQTTTSPSALPMIVSQDALRQYALSQVVHGSRSVYCPSMIWDENSVTYVRIDGSYGEEILNKLFKTNLTYGISNPDDQIRGYVWLYDKDWNVLFGGSASYTDADLEKGIKPEYTLWQQDVPLPLYNVSSAKIIALNPDGTSSPNVTDLLINNGQLAFPYWMAGYLNGLLVVTFQDGSAISYRLSGAGQPVGPEVVTESSDYKIQGHYVYSAPVGKTNVLVSIVELWNLPSVFIDGSNTTQTVAFDVTGVGQDERGSVFSEIPISISIINIETGIETTLPMDQIGKTVVNLPRGKFRICFTWVRFGQKGTLYTGDPYGGKG